jgi:hypothetical protein
MNRADFKEKYPGELRLINDSSIDPLVNWAREFLKTSDEISANDFPRDLPEKMHVLDGDGRPRGNHVFGPVLRRLQMLGAVYPVKRIPAAGLNDGSHRDVTLYRASRRPQYEVMELPAGRRLVEGVALLVRATRKGIPGPSQEALTSLKKEDGGSLLVDAYTRGWYEALSRIQTGIAWETVVQAELDLGIDLTEQETR